MHPALTFSTRAAFLVVMVHVPIAHTAELTIAVAANFAAPMKQLAKTFEQDTHHQITLSYGATGNFYAQIKQGAPYAIFLAADQNTPAKLEQEGLAIKGSRFTYAIGKLVLWTNKPAYQGRVEQVFKSAQFDKLAIANPKLAPYGAAAMQAIQGMRLTQSLSTKLIEAANIGQAYQFVSTQNTDLGLIALSQVYENGQINQGFAWLVPQNYYNPIAQDAVVLKRGENQAAVAAFMTYLRSDKAKRIIRNYGYDI